MYLLTAQNTQWFYASKIRKAVKLATQSNDETTSNPIHFLIKHYNQFLKILNNIILHFTNSILNIYTITQKKSF